MEKYNEFPSMEEKKQRLQDSRAVSPGSAAAKVLAISGMEPEQMLKWNSELDILAELLPERRDASGQFDDWFRKVGGNPIRSYQELVPVLEKLLPDHGGANSHAGVLKPEPEFNLTFGGRFTNAMLLLAFVFHHSAKEEKKMGRLGYCLRMTLGDYTDAVIDLSFTDSGKLDEKHVKWAKAWKEKLLAKYSETTPLADVIEEILYRYLEGWQMIGYAEHVVKCRNWLVADLEEREEREYWNSLMWDEEDACEEDIYDEDAYEEDAYDEDFCEEDACEEDACEEETGEECDEMGEPPEISEAEDEDVVLLNPDNETSYDEWDIYGDYAWEINLKETNPRAYYLFKAQEYDGERPNLADCSVSVSTLAEVFFLQRDVYRMDVFREMLSSNGDSEFLALLEEHTSDAKLLKSINEVNAAAGMLKVLLYDPYHGTGADDAIGKYHYERHLGA